MVEEGICCKAQSKELGGQLLLESQALQGGGVKVLIWIGIGQLVSGTDDLPWLVNDAVLFKECVMVRPAPVGVGVT